MSIGVFVFIILVIGIIMLRVGVVVGKDIERREQRQIRERTRQVDQDSYKGVHKWMIDEAGASERRTLESVYGRQD